MFLLSSLSPPALWSRPLLPRHLPGSLMITPPLQSVGSWTRVAGVVGCSTSWIGRVMVLRRDVGCRAAPFWIHPSSLSTIGDTLTSRVERLEASIEGGHCHSPRQGCVFPCLSCLSVCQCLCRCGSSLPLGSDDSNHQSIHLAQLLTCLSSSHHLSSIKPWSSLHSSPDCCFNHSGTRL